MKHRLEASIIGTLLGTAVGDAIGLPYEGLSRDRRRVLYPMINHHRLVFGKGMISDDTEHTCFVAQSLIASAGNVEQFRRELAGRLQFWLLGLPAGIGLATLRSICRLWVGIAPQKSGVFSAGNGPAMRVTLLGVCYGDQPEYLRRMVQASTRITHTDPKAEYGAMAVAIAAYLASLGQDVLPNDYAQLLNDRLPVEAEALLDLIKLAVASAVANESTIDFANSIGCRGGVSGYVYQTVPVVIQTWLRYQDDYLNGILEIVQAGGDTDTTAAILGGIIGARVGKLGIPQLWVADMLEWPRSMDWIERLGRRLVQVLDGDLQPALPVFVPGLILRNLGFLMIVLFHGFRRLLPPYQVK
ncbi:ADP-ribosylglycohydrolase family protein [filamentous cyanobacterium LEGE 11480]|uniref:ADP-ribosylglycohydrolase family protein n=1 Tax=Romeriopsis navalis LEGE 11480 TaxID=2777977 RepID=A0A928Z276_9CYAN|nr:ADP-ribosylglycohydrolase family protein [Romeriopsis navalis]MBE9029254.1 ADP-ribosylglycohydrolase family protein [Romeriopsis navalis LEGE 11480]